MTEEEMSEESRRMLKELGVVALETILMGVIVIGILWYLGVIAKAIEMHTWVVPS